MNLQVELVYEELRTIAKAYFRGEPPGHTLQPTALVNEALVRLASACVEPESGEHLVALCARTMRWILIDRARRNSRRERVMRESARREAVEPPVDVLDLEEALKALELASPRRARVVQLRCFVGLTVEEAAQVLGVSPGTVEADWTYARAWLRVRLAGRLSDALSPSLA